MNWKSLIQPKYSPDAFISGQYFVIKFTPDLVAGQVFNLGIGFIQDDTHQLHYRFLESNLKGFACIYGSEATSAIRVLLQSVSLALDTVGYISSPSPHISYTPLLPTKGLSLTSIMDSLYRDYIHMDHYVQKKVKKQPYINTNDLREEVHDRLKRHNKDKFYREAKIFLSNDLKKESEIMLDLPIWKDTNNDQYEMFNDSLLFASIVSADYVENEALSFNLDYLGCTSIQNACTLLRDKHPKAGLFIYKPTLSERINQATLDKIENHIDSSLYLLERMKKRDNYDIDIEVLDSEQEISEKVLEFVA